MYLGLDLSLTGTGVCLIDSQYQIVFQKKLTTKSFAAERLYLLENELKSILDEYRKSIDLVCIEGPSYLSEKGHLFEIGEWTGVVKVNLYKSGLNFILATPQQLKKYVLGKGGGKDENKKELIILDIYKKFGVEIRENNIADAYVLARICRDYYLKENSVPIHQLEVLKKISERFADETSGCVLK